MLRFFLPPGQDITSLMYPDGFRQAQAVWLCETRQDGLSAPCSPCCDKSFLLVYPLVCSYACMYLKNRGDFKKKEKLHGPAVRQLSEKVTEKNKKMVVACGKGLQQGGKR